MQLVPSGERPATVHHLDPPRDRGRLPASFDRDQMAEQARADGERDGKQDNRRTQLGLQKIAGKMQVRIAAVKAAAHQRYNGMLIAWERTRIRLDEAVEQEQLRREERERAERRLEQDDSPRRWSAVVVWIVVPLMIGGTVLDGEFIYASLASLELIGDTARAVIAFVTASLMTAVGLIVGLKWHAAMEEEDEDRRVRLNVLCVALTLAYLAVLGALSQARDAGAKAQQHEGAANISTVWMAVIGLLVFLLGVAIAWVHADSDPRRRLVKLAEQAIAAHEAAKALVLRRKEELLAAAGALEHAAQDTVRWLEEELGLWLMLHATHEDARIAAALDAFPDHTPVPDPVEPTLARADDLAREVLTPMKYQTARAELPDWMREGLLRRLTLPDRGGEDDGPGHGPADGDGNGNGNGHGPSNGGGGASSRTTSTGGSRR